ncbi:MAG: transketolase family protein [Bacteroidales bacterium]|nr:transketolase family protein [Bacteroidales bacterium]
MIAYQEKKDCRSGFGEGLLEAGRQNTDVVALCADLTGSVKMNAFAEAFPERFFQVGIAEANMIGMAAGMALSGKIPFVGSFANFCTTRVLDQIRMVVAYSNNNVKICGSHAGITTGEDGATHQVMEDIGFIKGLPNMTVINPCDFNQTKAATLAMARMQWPVYLRYGRPKVPNFTDPNQEFVIGKAIRMREGSDVTLFATGHLVYPALEAAEALNSEGISAEVVNIHTIKPLDSEAILESVRKTGCAVSCEEHSVINGLGDSIAAILVRHQLCPLEYVAMADEFGQSGKPEELMKLYGLDSGHIVAAAKRAIERKTGRKRP